MQSIVEEYNVLLMDTTDADNSEAGEDSMDEDAPTVKAGLAVLTLYLAVKTVAEYLHFLKFLPVNAYYVIIYNYYLPVSLYD